MLPRARCRGGCWPDWGSEALEALCDHLLGCTRRLEIVIGRSIPDGLRSAYRCIARQFWRQIGRAALLRTMQRDASHGLLLFCCPIVYFSTAAPASGQLDYPTTRQMQLAAVPKLLPPAEMSSGIPYTAAREVQGRLLTGLRQRDDRILV